MASTALNMVNRVLKKARRDTVNDVTGDLAAAVLDCVNDAAQEILEVKDWPFLYRGDGVISTRAGWTGTTASFTNGSTSITLPLSDAPNGVVSDLTGEVARIINTEDTTYGDTSFKIVSGSQSGANFSGTLEASFPGTTSSGDLSYRVFFAEYMLPDTVGDVLSVRHEEEELYVEQVDETWVFDRRVPKPHDEFAEPTVCYVGGQSQPTYDDSGSAPDYQTRLALYPIPDAIYVLRYSYRMRHARMSASTDTLAGVPEYIITDIVDLGFAIADSTAILNNPERGALNRRNAERVNEQHHARSNPSRGRRMGLASLDRKAGVSRSFGRLPDDEFGSLSGDTTSRAFD